MTKQQDGIVTPHEHDVLSGRGNFVNYHAGNEHFRALVRKHKVAYVACPKPQKGQFSKMIYDEIRNRNPPGRFLKQDLKTKLWYDIGEKKALDKTRQALREGAPEIQKELGGENDYDDDGVEFDDSPPSQSPLQQQQGFLFQNDSNFIDRTPTYGMRNFVNQMQRVPLPFEDVQPVTSNSHLDTSSGIHPPSPHMVRRNMQQLNDVVSNSMENSSRMAHIDPPIVSAAMSAQRPMMPRSSRQDAGMIATQEQLQQLRHQQQHHQQQQLQLQLQQLQLLQQSQQLRETREHLVVPLRAQSSSAQHDENPHRNLRSFSESGSTNSRFSSLQNNSSIFALPSQYEPRPIDPYHFNQQTNNVTEPPVSPSVLETEDVAPLPSRRNVRDRKNAFDREGSCSSLVVDNIFGADGRDSKLSETGGNATTGKSAKFNMSSQQLSALSLSMDDMGHDDDYNQLGSLLNNSMRLSIRGPPKYNFKNSDGPSLTDHGSGTSNTGTLLAGLDMSVATLGDRFSDFDGSMARMMTDSQTDMSFGNVFDDTDKDLYTSGSKIR